MQLVKTSCISLVIYLLDFKDARYHEHKIQFWIPSPQTHNVSGTAEMTCNTVPSQCDPVEWDDTKQHVE